MVKLTFSNQKKADKFVHSAWVLIILNCFDGIATYIGISLILITEANPIMSQLDPTNILLIKILLSAMLAVFILHYPIKQFSNRVKYLLGFANICYVGVFVFHIYWIGLSMGI